MTARGEDMSRLVLSLDGGGIRGAATTQFLTHVEAALMRAHGKTLRDCVDFYAGTSTGSIIALALATTDLTIAEINDIYSYERAKDIFNENRGFLEIDGINAPKYEGAGKTKALKDNFGDAKLGDVGDDKHVLAVSYGVDDGCGGAEVDQSGALRARFLAGGQRLQRRAYLLPDRAAVHGRRGRRSAGRRRRDRKQSDHVCDRRVDQGVAATAIRICVLSVGTGYRTRRIDGDASTEWGKSWFTKGHILDVLTDERVVAYQETIIADGNYIRVNADMRKQAGQANPPWTPWMTSAARTSLD